MVEKVIDEEYIKVKSNPQIYENLKNWINKIFIIFPKLIIL